MSQISRLSSSGSCHTVHFADFIDLPILAPILSSQFTTVSAVVVKSVKSHCILPRRTSECNSCVLFSVFLNVLTICLSVFPTERGATALHASTTGSSLRDTVLITLLVILFLGTGTSTITPQITHFAVFCQTLEINALSALFLAISAAFPTTSSTFERVVLVTPFNAHAPFVAAHTHKKLSPTSQTNNRLSTNLCASGERFE